MISKVIALAHDREAAIIRMHRALREYEIGGLITVIPALLWILEQEDFATGEFDTGYLDRALTERAGESFSVLSQREEELAVIAAALLAYFSGGESAPEPPVVSTASAWRQAARSEAVGER